jgi:hypothetical protein
LTARVFPGCGGTIGNGFSVKFSSQRESNPLGCDALQELHVSHSHAVPGSNAWQEWQSQLPSAHGLRGNIVHMFSDSTHQQDFLTFSIPHWI